jgi:hypothetical protein
MSKWVCTAPRSMIGVFKNGSLDPSI